TAARRHQHSQSRLDPQPTRPDGGGGPGDRRPRGIASQADGAFAGTHRGDDPMQGSINKLLVEAFAEESKSKLLQAVLLEPTVTSYRGAMEMVDEMLALQRDILPPIH